MKQILPFLLGILPAMYSFSQTGLLPDPEIWLKGDNSQLNVVEAPVPSLPKHQKKRSRKQ